MRPRLDSSRRSSRPSWPLVLLLSTMALCACGVPGTNAPPPDPVTVGNHRWFPIDGGVHAIGAPLPEGPIACESCHTTKETYAEFSCLGCHAHEPVSTPLLHTTVAGYAYQSKACYQCHPDGAHLAFDHAGLSIGQCATCHDVGAPFAALPKAGFTHPSTAGADCGACHDTTTWTDVKTPPPGASDPAHDLVLDALVPTWSGTTIASVTPLRQTLPMPMNHSSAALSSAALGSCTVCHLDTSTGLFFPGLLHSSLANADAGQPATCGDCHAATRPTGFVGALASNPARTPPTGEMRHDAVAWDGGAPTATLLVTSDCSVCHLSPTQDLTATWSSAVFVLTDGGVPVLRPDGGNLQVTIVPRFHVSLADAGLAQPGSCLDCHANSRASAVLTSANSSLPATLSFDHANPGAQADCAGCHAAGAAPTFAAWTGGRFHLPGSATPTTCLPCHQLERPKSTTGWTSTTYALTPFDFGGSDAGVTHGAGQDCALCHGGPGTGAWGGTQSWASGHYGHDAGTPAESTCLACHSTQRPDLATTFDAGTLGFDHALNGTGDCVGCHEATSKAGSYVHYLNPSTNALPGGDWKGGLGYPGSTVVSAAGAQVTLTTLSLTRTTTGFVTGMTSVATTLTNAMLHDSAAVPAQVFAGPTATPDYTKCWHCHTASGTTVTSYAAGKFHASLTAYTATPGGAPAPLPQPTSRCRDCHGQMRPPNIVEKAASSLVPMDHSATFVSAVTLNGVSVSGVGEIDCSQCHQNAGNGWADGVFHANVGAAVPADCVSCHFPLMATAASADVTQAKDFHMAHRSTQLTLQKCDACHTSALNAAKTTPAAAALWRTGAYHPSVAATQPTACIDCHAVSMPDAGVPTQSTWSYALTKGGTSTNQGQWMNHASSAVAGKDCAACHLADAKPSGSAWQKSDELHGPVPKPTTCQECHGLTNGGGAVAGTKNNLPLGLTDSSTLSTAFGDGGTGVPATTVDQLSHQDGTVAKVECSFCHSQAGRVPSGAVSGQEWAQAKFHLSFTTARPLVTNGTTARCSTCHLNVKPTSAYTEQDHSTFTAVSGSVDCVACHSWPGTGTPATPNWLGAAAMPPFISVGGFTIPAPPAATPVQQAGIANLPHPNVPSGTPCTTCHATSAGGRKAKGYDHASALINSKCAACHEAGSDLVATPWNNATLMASGAGDTRPITLTNLKATYKGNSRSMSGGKLFSNLASAKVHFYPVDCKECHVKPTGNGLTQTGTAYTSAPTGWNFPHTKTVMTNPATCKLCHDPVPN